MKKYSVRVRMSRDAETAPSLTINRTYKTPEIAVRDIEIAVRNGDFLAAFYSDPSDITYVNARYIVCLWVTEG